MIAFFANTFGYVLNFIYGFVENYGVAIILFSIVLKIVLLPLSVKQQKTMIKSSKIQGKVKEIQNKYKDNKEKMNQEIMQLYKNENMSPFSGCLSSIIQIVLIIAMFSLVRNPITYMKKIDVDLVNSCITELKQINGEENVNRSYPQISLIKYINNFENVKEEIEEINNVSGEETMLEKVTSEKENVNNVVAVEENNKAEEKTNYINENKEKMYINMEFLGLDLSNIPNQNRKDLKVFIIPVLYVLTSIVSMRLTTNMSKNKKKDLNNKEEEEDMTTQMNKSMNWMMPIMSVSISLVAPLGLALYWLVNNILNIIERVILNKLIKTESEE